MHRLPRQATATEKLRQFGGGIYFELAGGESPTLDIAIDAIAKDGWILLVSQRPAGAWINYQRVMFPAAYAERGRRDKRRFVEGSEHSHLHPRAAGPAHHHAPISAGQSERGTDDGCEGGFAEGADPAERGESSDGEAGTGLFQL